MPEASASQNSEFLTGMLTLSERITVNAIAMAMRQSLIPVRHEVGDKAGLLRKNLARVPLSIAYGIVSTVQPKAQ